MALSKAESDRLKAEMKKQADREAETTEQKWLRGAMKETLAELLEEKFGDPDEDDEEKPPKSSGPNVFDLGSLFGGGKSKTG
jgi:predicted AAA+ superfamily ATPase